MNVPQIISRCPLRMLQHKTEFTPFCEWLVAARVRSVLEIGTGPGGTAWVFGEITEQGVVTSVDCSRDVLPAHSMLADANPYFLGLLGDSRSDEIEAAVQLRGTGVPFDLVFIDADHTYAAIKENYERYGKLARMAVAFHDINASMKWPGMGMPTFWNEVKLGRTNIEFVSPGPYAGHVWGGIGVLTV